jgi:hypothetical protein
MKRLFPGLLKLLAVTVALAFLGGAMVAAASELFSPPPALAASGRDAGAPAPRLYFNATKSAPLPLHSPRVVDAGAP